MSKKNERQSIHDWLDWRSEIEFWRLTREELRGLRTKVELRGAREDGIVLRTEVELRGLLREIGTPPYFTHEALETMRKEIGGTLKLWRMANKAGISDGELELLVVCFLALHWEGLSDLEMKELLEGIDAGVMAERESLRILTSREKD